MSMPTERERKHWWLLAYAHTSFEKSLDACRLLVAQVASTDDDLYLPLAVAVHALYGRPFKSQRGVGKLPNDYIPDDWQGVHQALITFRDQLLLHTDASTIKQAGRPLHDVVYHNIESERLFSTSDPRPRLDHYRFVSGYLPRLIQRVRRDLERIHERFGDCMPRSEGHYLLNLTGEPLFTVYESPDENIHFEPEA